MKPECPDVAQGARESSQAVFSLGVRGFLRSPVHTSPCAVDQLFLSGCRCLNLQQVIWALEWHGIIW